MPLAPRRPLRSTSATTAFGFSPTALMLPLIKLRSCLSQLGCAATRPPDLARPEMASPLSSGGRRSVAHTPRHRSHLHCAPCPSPSLPSHRHVPAAQWRRLERSLANGSPRARPSNSQSNSHSLWIPDPDRSASIPPERYSDEYTAATPAAAAASPNATSCGSFSRSVPATAPRVDLRLARSHSYSRKALDLKANSPS